MTSPIVHDKHTRPEQVEVHMQDVECRSIRRLGYNPETQQLVIQFYDSLPGLRTVYSPVPREVFEGLMNAESMMQYLEKNIRYTYDFALVDEDGLIDPEKTRQSRNGEI
ncbi:MAG: KTSC domain-containing protein [Halofilum sp. (in: g-proteobacteria)]